MRCVYGLISRRIVLPVSALLVTFRSALSALLLGAFSFTASAGEIAITIDDLPYLMPSRSDAQEGHAIVHSVVQALAKYDITAMGFVIGKQVNRSSESAVQTFVDAGHEVANHSWSHADYNNMSVRSFRREVRRTDKVLQTWLGPEKYFRFPYLHEGTSADSKLAARVVLEDFGYVNVPVTIDNDEWRFNQAYVQALELGDQDGAAQIARDYLQHMKDQTLHFQSLAQSELGRDVKHILLLHMNQINADHLETLLDWYAAEGWGFISVKDALTDPLFAMPDLYVGPKGLSMIERVLPR